METATNQRLDLLTAQKAALELERDVATLEAEVRSAKLAGSHVVRESGVSWGQGWGDFVQSDRFTFDGVGLSNFGDVSLEGYVSRAYDRRRGDNRPFWSSEIEHATIRGIARVIAEVDEVGGSALKNLTNYCVGEGLSYDVTVADSAPKTRENRDLAVKAQSIVDDFRAKNGWDFRLERNLFREAHRDGEVYIVLYQDGLVPRARVCDPSFVTAPERPRELESYLGVNRSTPNGDALDWKYGHAAPWNDASRTQYVFVSWYGDELEWEAFPAAEFAHLKLNVDRDVKRGMTDYYPVYKTLQHGSRLLSNTVQGAAIQAAIAYIREHAGGLTPDQIKAYRGRTATDSVTRSTPLGGTYTAHGRQSRPGKVVDVPQGAKFHAGPLGNAKGDAYIRILQAALRIVGTRWQMPEHMISGDASNNNFASILAAGSPFTKSAEAEQALYCLFVESVLWRVLSMSFRNGSFSVPPGKARRLIKISADGPAVSVEDRLQEHQIRREEYEAGVLSAETWSAEAGRDRQEELARGACPQPRPAAAPPLPSIR